MVKVWFPSMYLKLISLKLSKSPPQALLQIPPSMTKTEVKEYLHKIYDINVLNVMTANYLGTRYNLFIINLQVLIYIRL